MKTIQLYEGQALPIAFVAETKQELAIMYCQMNADLPSEGSLRVKLEPYTNNRTTKHDIWKHIAAACGQEGLRGMLYD